MLNSIFYIISIITLILSFILLKKSDEKQNLIKWIFISFGLLFCYNAIISYILNIIGVPIYLQVLSIINFIISIVLCFFIAKKSGNQIYYVQKKDVVAVSIISIVVLLFCVLRFGFPFNIIYETCDPGTHFWTAKDFYEQSYLLDKVTDKTIVNFETRQFASYTNLGILFKVFSPFIDEFDFYQVYILFDILMLLLSSLIFYCLISSGNKKIPFIIYLIGSVLYTLGYPLNSMLIGFFYLGHSIMLITLLFILFKMYDNNYINRRINHFLLCIVMLGLFFTYYFFVPVIFGGLVIYFIYKLLKNKQKILTKENAFFVFTVFVLPCILGFIYFIIPNLGSSEQNVLNQITLEGDCYIDLLSSIILFIPIVIYYILFSITNKNVTFDVFVYLLLVIFIIFIMFLLFYGGASVYYLSKVFYLLWLMHFVIMFNFIDKYYSVKKIEIICYLCFMLFCALLSFFNISKKFENITQKYIDMNYSIPFSIYSYNMHVYENPLVILKNSEMSELKKLYNKGVRNVVSNALPQARLWLVTYFETEKINYPENQLYDYICENYYHSGEDFGNFFDNEKQNIILFYRRSIREFWGYDKNEVYDYEMFDNYKSICLDCYIKDYENFLYIESN